MKRGMRRPFPFGMGNIGGYPNYNPFSQFDSFGYPDAKYFGFEDQVPSAVDVGGSKYSPLYGYGTPSFGPTGYGYPSSPYGGSGFPPGFGGGYGLGYGGGPGVGYGGGISPLGAGLLGFGAGLLGGALFDNKGRWYY